MGTSFTQHLRIMKVGETKVFTFPTTEKVHSSASLAYRFGQMYGFRFKCIRNFEKKELTVTKERNERD